MTATLVIDLSNLASADGFIIQGAAAGDWTGYSVSSAGDVNGDGIDDLIVGAPYGGSNAGEAYVIYGQSGATRGTVDLTNLTPAQGFAIQGAAANDLAGWSVSSAGDVNGDGIGDLIVGAPNGTAGGFLAGESYVIYGQSGATRGTLDLSNLTAAQGFAIQGDAALDTAGRSVSSAGDVNGDGISDLIVGAPTGDNGGSDAGEAYVIYGQSGATRGTVDLTNLAPAQGFIIQGDAANDLAGWSVSAAGDVNGDGIGDLIVGAPTGDNGGSDAGEAYVIYGQSGATRGTIDLTNLTAAQGFAIQGDAAGDHAGRSVSAAGDVNGDGIGDLIVGAPYGDNGGSNAGEAYVIYGQSGAARGTIDLTNLAPAQGFIIQGDVANDLVGWSVSAAGDVNGDGIGDLIVGAPHGGSGDGEAYVIFGQSGATRGTIDLTNLTESQGFAIQGAAASDQAGWSVSAAGDVNGDGIDDLIVGAPRGDTGGSDAGDAYVIYGSTTIGGIQGTAGNDTLTGTTGADLMFGLAGNDSLIGLAGDDTLNGGTGADTLVGGAGNDTYITDGGDTITEASNAGTDLVQSSVSYTLGANLENLTLTGSAAINGTGNALANVITGNSGNNILNGASGSDTLVGGIGNDTYITDGGDTITEASNAGTDLVKSSVSYTLGANLENLVLTGSAAIDGTGNALANKLNGNSGNNILNGGTGADTLVGGAGDDTYITDGGDTITEASNAGTDLVQSSVTLTLGADLENLVLTGSAAINGTGNALANVITGNSGNNILNGASGFDTLVGGAGNDTYITDGGDTITEASNAGTDLVKSSVSYTLGSNLENLTLTGSAGIDGTGNTLANVITGNAGNNILNGGAGSDTLVGGVGNDTYVIDGGDTITEASNAGTDLVQSSVSYTLGSDLENLTLTGSAAINGTGNTLANVITGNAGNNILHGGTGADTLVGGAGDDIYVTDGGDTITEASNAGTDLVKSSVSYTLGANLENLVLTGSDAINGTGNALANKLNGNSGNNILNGASGFDTLVGGAGNDTFITDGGDTITEASNAGTDLVKSSVSYTLGSNLENLTLTGSAGIDGTGNTLANVITGNAGNNILNGSTGADTLVGGAGSDTFMFNTALSAGNVDHITDFNVLADTIDISHNFFTGLIAGVLAATAFASNSTGLAGDASDRIVYENDTGNLYFDPDGTGPAARILFAQVSAGLALTSADFFIL